MGTGRNRKRKGSEMSNYSRGQLVKTRRSDKRLKEWDDGVYLGFQEGFVRGHIIATEYGIARSRFKVGYWKDADVIDGL